MIEEDIARYELACMGLRFAGNSGFCEGYERYGSWLVVFKGG